LTERGLSGRRAVVTGAGRGIGAAIARSLSREGTKLLIASRTLSEVQEVAAKLEAGGGQVWATAADVSREADVKRLGTMAIQHLGGVDILVHSAGAAASAPLAKISLEDWNQMIASNATSAFLCVREFVPGMLKWGWGRIVIVASIAGLEGGKYIVHYSAAKHAVVGLTRSLALEVDGSGVTVNAICPGYVDTPMTEQTLANIQNRAWLKREEALAAVLATTGQTRLLEPSEVADRVVDLCRAEASGINGEAIVIHPEERDE
jgi:NAD(P)-dependent dehydrogenase (short-subunit alcohol dehydrogenase family)